MQLKNINSSDWQELFRNKNVIIFGAGIAGKATMKILKFKGINIFGFHDNGAVVPYQVENIPVSRMDFSKIDNQKFVFVLAIRNIDEAIKQLQEFGEYDWIAAYKLLNDETKSELDFMEVQKLEAICFYFERFLNKNLLVLDSLDFVITERCSLRCKECSNLMQYYSAPKDFSVENLKLELDAICEVFDEIYEIRLIGGEPFVNPHWSEILQYVATKEKIKRISIYTNGTILPTDSQCENLKKTNAWLSISDYDELSRNLKPLKNKLDSYFIPYEVKGVPYWTRCSSFVKHNRSKKELIDVFKKCCARNLATLLKGKLYPCPFISNAMNLLSIPQNENDYVDLAESVDVEILRQKVRRLISQPFYNSCEWCEGRPTPENIKDEEKIPPHEQIKKPLPYIRYDDINPKLNIVIPVYNVEKYLGQCLDSVQNQTFKNFNVILVNDGSTDNSLAICEEYQKKDNRISIINQNHLGPSSARNRAISEIEMKNGGGYLIFIDADDWIEPEMFETFVRYMDSNSEADICLCNGFVNDLSGQQRNLNTNIENEKLLDSKTALNVLFDIYGWTLWSKIYRLSLFNEFNFEIELHIGEDRLLNWQLFKKSRKVGVIPYKGYHYRMNPSGLSSKSYFQCPYPYDLIKSAVKIYEDRGDDADSKILATNHLIDMSISWLFRFLVKDKFTVDVEELKYYLNFLEKNKTEILQTVSPDSERKILFLALAQNFDSAKADCCKIYNEFLSDLKNFYDAHENIFIYGTGNFGREIAETLNNLNCKNYSFVVSSLSGKSSEEILIEGEIQPRTILALNALVTNPADTGIILAMNKKNLLQVIPAIKARGYKNIFDGNKLGLHL